MTLDFSRWQFGITTVFHFMFVPSRSAASCCDHADAAYGPAGMARGTKVGPHDSLFAAALLINFAIGVVTGIVQEFSSA